jgi:hypothetical protein
MSEKTFFTPGSLNSLSLFCTIRAFLFLVPASRQTLKKSKSFVLLALLINVVRPIFIAVDALSIIPYILEPRTAVDIRDIRIEESKAPYSFFLP